MKKTPQDTAVIGAKKLSFKDKAENVLKCWQLYAFLLQL